MSRLTRVRNQEIRFGFGWDCHPLWSAFPDGSPTVLFSRVIPVASTPGGLASTRFGLFRGRSPLLTESLIAFSSSGYWGCFTSPGSLPAPMDSAQDAAGSYYPPRVSPFGYPRIKAWCLAPRSFSQLPTSFIAS